MENTKYMNPYLAGIGLGLTLLAAFVLVGRGLGASGAMMRFDVWIMNIFTPQHVLDNKYYSEYAVKPLSNWLVYQILGVMAGGFISGALAGRLKWSVGKGPNVSVRSRMIFAFAGGAIMGYAARFANGCTSGQALTGGATLALGSWAFMIAVFVGGYLTFFFVRKQWL